MYNTNIFFQKGYGCRKHSQREEAFLCTVANSILVLLGKFERENYYKFSEILLDTKKNFHYKLFSRFFFSPSYSFINSYKIGHVMYIHTLLKVLTIV